MLTPVFVRVSLYFSFGFIFILRFHEDRKMTAIYFMLASWSCGLRVRHTVCRKDSVSDITILLWFLLGHFIKVIWERFKSQQWPLNVGYKYCMAASWRSVECNFLNFNFLNLIVSEIGSMLNQTQPSQLRVKIQINGHCILNSRRLWFYTHLKCH